MCSIVRNEREAKIKRKKRGERRFENENSISSGVVLAQRFASRERGDSLVGGKSRWPGFRRENVSRTAGGKYLAPAISYYGAGPQRDRGTVLQTAFTRGLLRFTAELRARVSCVSCGLVD